jgi:hypothetical protein
MAEPDSGGWVRLEAERTWMRFVDKVGPFDFAPTEWWGLLIVIPLGILYFVALALLLPVLPRPHVNMGERKLRIGRRIWDFADINTAELTMSNGAKKQNIDLKFGRTGGVNLYVKLAIHGNRVIDRATQTLLEKLIDGSSIPTQRERNAIVTTGHSYPTGLSREGALEAIRNSPS